MQKGCFVVIMTSTPVNLKIIQDTTTAHGADHIQLHLVHSLSPQRKHILLKILQCFPLYECENIFIIARQSGMAVLKPIKYKNI